MKNIVTIVDYGINNIQSVIEAIKFIGVKVEIAIKPSELVNSSHIIIPGVGAFPEGIKKLKNLGLDQMIINKAKQKSKILGICLGMQMLFTKSDEYGEYKGLNLIPGEVTQIQHSDDNEEKIQVIGWRETKFSSSKKKNFLNEELNKKYFYYLHSYHVIPKRKQNIIAYYNRGKTRINSIVCSENIWGVQFHPEKSGEAGLNFLKNFFSFNTKK